MLHAPPKQLGVPLLLLHAMPHDPQLLTLVVRFASQPLLCALPSQLPQPALHAMLHAPKAQFLVPFAVLHTTPQRHSLLWGEEPNLAYDWSLLVGAAGWVSPEWKLNFDDPHTKYALRVDVWLVGGLTVEAIDLPAGVRLSVDRGSPSTTQPAAPEAGR